ncbi:MAG: threonine-phosphate decarboxylase CobD [Syntrophomonadaceae bacterium]|nr:threonine-phosphate decarboxylase CobD [Syntrophomonadaceae bacterium]
MFKPRIHGGNIYEAAQQNNLKAEEILDFSASVSPLGVPEAVMQAVKNSLGTIAYYPDPDCKVFRQAAASQAGVGSENILAGNGAAELIYLIVRMINPGIALMPIPTFSEYGYAVNSIGGKLQYIQLQPEASRFIFPVDQMCQSIREADLAFICNPNNPTGTLLKPVELREILEAGRANNCFIVVDEAYLDFVEDGSDYSAVNNVFDYKNLLIIKSLTKVYSLPGLRIGYGIGPPDLIEQMNTLREPWAVNILAQAAGAAALKAEDYHTRLQELVRGERQYLYEEIKRLPGLKPFMPTANFLLVDTSQTGIPAAQWQEILLRSRLLIRDCTSFEGMGPYFFRIAVRTRSENIRLIQALARAVSVL